MNDLAQMSGIVGGGEEQDSGSRYSSTLGRHTTGLDISANTRGKQDLRTLCELSDAFSGGIGSQSTRGYQQTGGNKRKSRFSFGKLVGDVIVNSLLGGLTSTMYYGADRAVGAVSDGIRRRRSGYRQQIADSESGSNSVYIPMDADGNPIPLNKQRITGQDIPLPDLEAQGRPHTVLGGKVSSETGEVYRQSATFSGGSWPTANGYEVPLSEVHWTNHGRAHVHTNPHQHVFNYDFENRYWYRSDPEIF